MEMSFEEMRRIHSALTDALNTLAMAANRSEINMRMAEEKAQAQGGPVPGSRFMRGAATASQAQEPMNPIMALAKRVAELAERVNRLEIEDREH